MSDLFVSRENKHNPRNFQALESSHKLAPLNKLKKEKIKHGSMVYVECAHVQNKHSTCGFIKLRLYCIFSPTPIL